MLRLYPVRRTARYTALRTVFGARSAAYAFVGDKISLRGDLFAAGRIALAEYRLYSEIKIFDLHIADFKYYTDAIAGGVDAKTLSGILGHANASFTLDNYTHVTTDMKKSTARIVGNFMDEIIGGVENG